MTSIRPAQILSAILVVGIYMLFGADFGLANEGGFSPKSNRDPYQCILSSSYVSLHSVAFEKADDSYRIKNMELILTVAEESSLLDESDRLKLISSVMLLLRQEVDGTLRPPLNVDRSFFLLKALYDIHLQVPVQSDTEILLTEAERTIARGFEKIANFHSRESSLYFSQDDITALVGLFVKKKVSLGSTSDTGDTTDTAKTKPSATDPTLPGKPGQNSVTAPTEVIVESEKATFVASSAGNVTDRDTTSTERTPTESKVLELPSSVRTSQNTSSLINLSNMDITGELKKSGQAPELSDSSEVSPAGLLKKLQPEYIAVPLLVSLFLILLFFLRRSPAEKGEVVQKKKKNASTVMDPLMTGDMALNSGDYKRAVREFSSLLSDTSKGKTRLPNYLRFEAEARLCLAYVGMKDYERLPFVIDKLNYAKIYDRTLVSLAQALLDCGEFEQATIVAEKALEYEIQIDFFEPFFRKLTNLTDTKNAESMALAFRNKYRDFHLIHRGKATTLFRVLSVGGEQPSVMRIFDRKLLVKGRNPLRVLTGFEQFCKDISALELEMVIPVVDYGLRPFPFMVSTFICGEPLDLLIKTPGRGGARFFLDVLEEVARLLSRLHEQGLYHGAVDAKSILTEGKNIFVGGFTFSDIGEPSDLAVKDVQSLGKIAAEMVLTFSKADRTENNILCERIKTFSQKASECNSPDEIGMVFELLNAEDAGRTS